MEQPSTPNCAISTGSIDLDPEKETFLFTERLRAELQASSLRGNGLIHRTILQARSGSAETSAWLLVRRQPYARFLESHPQMPFVHT
jgi:hypothetical protein